jgi:hypothetical protein
MWNSFYFLIIPSIVFILKSMLPRGGSHCSNFLCSCDPESASVSERTPAPFLCLCCKCVRQIRTSEFAIFPPSHRGKPWGPAEATVSFQVPAG